MDLNSSESVGKFYYEIMIGRAKNIILRHLI